MEGVIDLSTRVQAHIPSRGKVRQAVLLLANLLIFAGLTTLIMANAGKKLFNGLDGGYMLSQAKSQAIWRESPFYSGNEVLQGIGGNITFTLNTWLDPGYVLIQATGFAKPALGYVLWASMLFVSTYVLARAASLRAPIALVAAWLAPVLIMWPTSLQFIPVTGMIPHLATMIAVTNAAMAIVIWCAPKRVRWYVLRALLLFGLAIYVAYSQPAMLILMAPPVVAATIAKVVVSKNNRMRLAESFLVITPALLFAVLGPGAYVLGQLKYSAANHFGHEMFIARGSLADVSTAFVGPFIAGGAIPISAVTISVCIIGFFMMLRRKPRHPSCVAFCITAAMLLLLIAASGAATLWSTWSLPSPYYFEFFLWPMYAIGVAQVIVLAAWSVLGRFSRRGRRELVVMIPLAVSAVAVLFAMNLDEPSTTAIPFGDEDNIIRNLESLQAKPGGIYAGRVATITGTQLSGQGKTWMDLHGLDWELAQDLGSDYRTNSLWWRSVPTLVEYNSSMTPRSYFTLTRVLAIPGDRQLRQILALRRVNIPLLRLVGARVLLTDSLSESLPLIAQVRGDKHAIYAYEIPQVNTRGYSPTRLKIVNDVTQIPSLMSNPGFDPASDAIVPPGQYPNLTSADYSEIVLEPGGYDIKASSRGSTLLVLPVESSHCWEMEVETPLLGVKPRLVTVDGVLIGVLFNKKLDAKLRYRNGPFTNPTCRLQDSTAFFRESG